MATVNYIDDALPHPQLNVNVTGARLMEIQRVVTIAAGDDNGSIYLLGELPGAAILESITLEGPAITGASDIDVGLFEQSGAAISGKGNCFADQLDLSSISGLPTGPTGDAIRQAGTAIALADANKKIYEHAGHVNKAFPGTSETQKKDKYRVGLTANTVGSADGTLVARIRYFMP